MRYSGFLTGALAAALLSTTAMTTAVAADLGAPMSERFERAFEPSPVSGNLSIWGAGIVPSGYWQEDNDTCTGDDDDKFCQSDFGFGSDGRVHYDIGNGYGFQLENLIDYHFELDSGDSDKDDEEHSLYAAAGAHVIHRGDSMAWGGFAGLSGTAHLDQDERSVHGFIGAEAAVFRGQSTYFGQVGFNKFLKGDDAVDNLFFGRLGVRHFFDPNKRLEGSIAGGFSDRAEIEHNGNDEDNEDLHWLQFATNYEHQFANRPLSWFAGYQGDWLSITDGDGPFDARTWVHTFKVGLRLSFGGSLQEQDNYGARTFDFTNLRAPLSYPDEM